LHGKIMPWFVSNVNVRDLEGLLGALEIGDGFGGDIGVGDMACVQEVGGIWRALFDEGNIVLQVDPFWATQHPFGRMPEFALKLYESLSESELVVFKGDLNHRKLTFDALWPRTTSFREALGKFGELKGSEGARILSLRTCKADICVGLKDQPLADKLDKESEGLWSTNGRYAVVSYWDGKK
jgi:hypothetical protein